MERIRTPANRRSVASRATWWRWALADELKDENGLFLRAAGGRGWLGRRRPWQSLAVAAAACGGGAVALGEDWSGLGVTQRDQETGEMNWN